MEQLSKPDEFTPIVAADPLPALPKQRRLLTLEPHPEENEPPVVEQLAGAVPIPPDTAKLAHSFARPVICPMLAPALAALRADKYLGSATADSKPITATTIINSTRVKPV